MGTTLTAEHLWRLPRVGSPRLSPDGRTVACTVSTTLPELAGTESSIYLVPASGGAWRRLTAGNHKDSDPVWSPDGARLAFLRKPQGEDAVGQVHVIRVDGGEAEALTDLPVGPSSLHWHPDGQRVIFSAPWIQGATDWKDLRVRRQARKDSTCSARATELRLYRFWMHWLHDEDYPHLFQVRLADREVTDLTPGFSRWGNLMEGGHDLDLAPDGRQLAFAALRTAPPYHDLLTWGIHVVDLDEGGAVGPPRELTEGLDGTFLSPRYRPDGAQLAYLWREDPEFYADLMRLGLWELETGDHRLLTAGWDRSVSPPEWAPDGSYLAFHAEEGHHQAIFTMPPAPGVPTCRVRQGTTDGVQVAPDGSLVFVQHDLCHPPQLARLPAGGEGVTRLTDAGADVLGEVQLGAVREELFTGAGGDRVGMLVVEPPGFDPSRRWPLLHLVHGGPHGQFGDTWHWRWNAQVMAGLGYVCALVNFHGSTGRGDAFTRSILGEHPIKPFEDVMRATDLLVESGSIDPERMAVAGGSYGGYLVTWIAGHTDRFRAIVNHAGVADLMTQMGSDVTHGRFKAYGGHPWTDLAAIERHSPTRFCRDMVTPMLVIHGEQDYRVPVGNALEVYGILKAKGVPARLVYYPDEGHWILKPANSVHWYGEVADWLARWLQRETTS
jgi:dipeptidyl aminopeptidase/acylaminoacyl peptidase